VRSSRQIERRCVEDLAFRVLAGNQLPDHVTVAHFRVRHQHALAGFLVESLQLCAAAGLVRLGVVALDGTKVAANAADRANRTLAELQEEAAEILREAADADQAEDHQHGPARGDELPAELAAAARAKGKPPRSQIKPRRRDEAPSRRRPPTSPTRQPPGAPPQRLGAGLQRPGGHHLRAGDRGGRAHPAHQRPATAATDAGRHHRDPSGRRDPQRPATLLADCGYWSIANLTQIPDAPELLIPPARHGRQGKPRKDCKPSASRSDGLRAAMTARLASADGTALYALRRQTIEPVFGQIKDNRGARRFTRRGLAACEAEWRLLGGTHNLLKLWRHTRSRPAPTPLAT
jgi:hypothetical protein